MAAGKAVKETQNSQETVQHGDPDAPGGPGGASLSAHNASSFTLPSFSRPCCVSASYCTRVQDVNAMMSLVPWSNTFLCWCVCVCVHLLFSPVTLHSHLLTPQVHTCEGLMPPSEEVTGHNSSLYCIGVTCPWVRGPGWVLGGKCCDLLMQMPSGGRTSRKQVSLPE